MRLLKIYGNDTGKYNYLVNYGVWQHIPGEATSIANVASLDYDIILLPQYKALQGYRDEFKRIKTSKAIKVLFDNDSCKRSFSDGFYKDIDYIFYRDKDRNGQTPKSGSFLRWSVCTTTFRPKYGGEGVFFGCKAGKRYPLREQISEFITPKKLTGVKYAEAIRNSAAAIHTDNPTVPAVRHKVLEFAASGTQIISNRTKNMDLYFSDKNITYFESIDHLKDIIANFKANEKIQKKLWRAAKKHSNQVRAKEVMEILKGL